MLSNSRLPDAQRLANPVAVGAHNNRVLAVRKPPAVVAEHDALMRSAHPSQVSTADHSSIVHQLDEHVGRRAVAVGEPAAQVGR